MDHVREVVEVENRNKVVCVKQKMAIVRKKACEESNAIQNPALAGLNGVNGVLVFHLVMRRRKADVGRWH